MSGQKHIPSPGGTLPNGTVYEQVEIGNTVQYAVKTDKGIEINPFLTVGEHVVYQPLSPSPWMLPPKPLDYGKIVDFWEELRQFVWDHLDIEDEDLYDVYVAWVLVTWIPEVFDSVSYLHFHGPRNSGKTRGLDILNYLCFRPLLSPSASGATVFRALDSFHPTFLLDEFEMYEKQKESKAEIIGIINAGYRRGQVVLRMTGMKEGTPMIKGFKVFGPKALSSIEDLPSALSSRCIRFPMTRTFRRIRRLVDKERAKNLRGKLLKWRFDHDLEEQVTLDNPLDLPDGRLIEMYYPLVSVAPTKEIKDRLLSCARGQYNTSIQDERATREAAVFNVIMDVLSEDPRLKISQKEVRDRYNDQVGDSEKVSNPKFAGVLKTLNFTSEMNNKTRRQDIIVKIDVLERRKNRYILAEDMERIDTTLNALRGAKKTGQSQLNVPLIPPSEEEAKPKKDISGKTLQEQLKIILFELSCHQEPVSTKDLAELVGLPAEDTKKLMEVLVRDGSVFSPVFAHWKTAI